MTGLPADEDAQDQVERTLLSWRRTALSLVGAGLLVAHLAARQAGGGLLLLTLVGTAGVVGYVWLSHDRRTGAAGIGLALGVSLLCVVALVGVAAR